MLSALRDFKKSIMYLSSFLNFQIPIGSISQKNIRISQQKYENILLLVDERSKRHTVAPTLKAYVPDENLNFPIIFVVPFP